MFEKESLGVVDHKRSLRINFCISGNRRARDPEASIGVYEDRIKKIKFFFDSILYFKGPKMKDRSRFLGAVGYVFIDQLIKRYIQEGQKQGILDINSCDIEDPLKADLESAFVTSFSKMFGDETSLYKLSFLDSTGIVFENTGEVLKTPDGHLMQFHNVNAERVRRLFKKDWTELTGGFE